MGGLNIFRNILQPIVSGGLPPRLKLPGEADNLDTGADPNQLAPFASDVNGYTGQGPLIDTSAPGGLDSSIPSARPTPSALPPSVGMSQQDDATTPPEPTSENASTPALPKPQQPNFAPPQSSLPPPPSMAPPQPTATPGSDQSALPPTPAIQPAQGLPPSVGMQQSQGDGLPPRPGNTARFPQYAGSPQLIPRSQAQFNQGMGQPQQPLPSMPGQPGYQNPVVQAIQQNALNPSPLPKPPSAWRQAAAIGVGMIGGPGFAPLIAYGPKGVQQIQARRAQDSQQAGLEKAATIIDTEEKNQNEAGNQKLQREQNSAKQEEDKRKNLQSEYDTQVNNIRTNLGHLLAPGATPSQGYYPMEVSRPDGKKETWVIPSENQRKLEAAQAVHESDVPVGDKITEALGMPKGTKVPVTSIASIHNSYVESLKQQNPDLDIIKLENDKIGDVTITARDKRTGKEVYRDVIKGAAEKKPQSDASAITALDRESARFAKPHEKSLADANAQLEKIADARAMINGNAESQALGIPKILTALVSGQGSGVRITQAELNAIAKARGISGDVQGYINKLSGKGTLTKEQQAQMTQILDDVKARLTQKQAIANEALDRINGAMSRDEIVKIDKEMRQKLTDFEKNTGGSSVVDRLVDKYK